MIAACKVFQPHDFGFRVRGIHVVDMEFPEIAHNNPARIQVVGQIRSIAPRLLKRREHTAVALAVAFLQINIAPFLLHKHFCVPDIGVNENRGIRVGILDLIFKIDGGFRVRQAKHCL